MNFMWSQIELNMKNLGKVSMCRCQQRNSIKALHMAVISSYHFSIAFMCGM